jgi:trigger factor
VKVTRDKTENSQAFLTIELEPAEVEQALEQSYRRLAGKANIPGFRKGKAPRAVLERHIGKDSLLEDALNNLLPQTYEKALKEQEIEPIAQPHIEMAQTDPVIFKVTVPLKPTVELGDYHSIRLTPESAELAEDEVDAVIEQLRRQHAVWEPVERGANFEDLVTLDIESQIEEKPFISQQGVQYQILKDQPLPIPGFADQLVGVKSGGEKEFKLQLPKDYSRAELAEKEAHFKVKVSEIKQPRLPKLDKEFARLVSPEFKTMAALRKQVTSNLKLRAEQKAMEEFEERVIDAVVDVSRVEFPPVFVEAEVDQLFNQQARWFQASGGKLEEYLSQINKTEEQVREEMRPLATKRVTRSLVLGKIAEEEKVEVTDAEINAELEGIAQSAGGDKDKVQELLESPQARSSVEQSLTTRKVIQRLVEIAQGPTEAGKKQKRVRKIEE